MTSLKIFLIALNNDVQKDIGIQRGGETKYHVWTVVHMILNTVQDINQDPSVSN